MLFLRSFATTLLLLATAAGALDDAWIRGFPGELERVLERNEATIDDLHVDEEGVFWVKHSRASRTGPTASC